LSFWRGEALWALSPCRPYRPAGPSALQALYREAMCISGTLRVNTNDRSSDASFTLVLRMIGDRMSAINRLSPLNSRLSTDEDLARAPTRRGGRLVVWIVCLLAVTAVGGGCSLVSDDSSPFSYDNTSPDFGDSYRIVTQRTIADSMGTRTVSSPPRLDPAPGDAPLADSTRLIVTVQYTGGCETHDFQLRAETNAVSNATLWLTHDAQGDLCERAVTEERVFTLPESVRSASSIQLLAPVKDPFTLR